MKLPYKIPILVAILVVCFFGTAVSIREFISPSNVLYFEAKVLERNLHQKEQVVNAFLRSESNVKKATQFSKNYDLAIEFLHKFTTSNIQLLVYNKDKLDFWSSFLVSEIDVYALKEGASFLKLNNGWYEAITRRYNDYTLVFLINVKHEYSYQNQFLINEVNPDLLNKSNLDIADNVTDNQFVNINSTEEKFLFAVKLKNTASNNFFTKLSLWSCLLGIFCLFLLLHKGFRELSNKGFHWLSILLFGTILFAFRWSDWEFGWLNRQYNVALFDPKIYAQSYFLPSLGDFLLNSIFITWWGVFVYQLRHKCRMPRWLIRSSWLGYLYLTLVLALVSLVGWQMDMVFYGLIENSKISLRVANIMSMNMLSVACIICLCLIWMSFYLGLTFLLEMFKQCQLSIRITFIYYLSLVFVISIGYLIFWNYTVFHLVLAIVVGIRMYQILVQDDVFKVLPITIVLLGLAVNSSIKYDRYNRLKERATRVFLAQRLEKRDQNALYAIPALEKEIRRDSYISNFFDKSNVNMHNALQNYVLKKYLSGYLAKFEFNLYEFDNYQNQSDEPNLAILDKYQSLVKSGASKLPESDYFYEVNGTFGYQVFFGLVPIVKLSKEKGTPRLLLLELKSKPIGNVGQLPDLLVEGKAKVEDEFKEYSIGFYKHGNLVEQIGKFAYPLKSQIFVNGEDKLKVIFDDGTGYGHVVYRSKDPNVIVITRKLNSFMEALATLSFYFLVFVLFLVMVLLIEHITELVQNYRFNWITFNRSMMLNANRVLYKTRIQVSMVFAVVTTLLIVGWITFYYVSKEYREQQQQDMNEKISATIANFENQYSNVGKAFHSQKSVIDFNYLAEINGVDINLYNASGDLEFSTLPKLFQKGIVMRKMDALSFIIMNNQNRSQFINLQERIGNYYFATAYAPIRDDNNQTLGYLCIPFFNNEVSYHEKINLFINTLINVYALVFVAIGFLAVAIANQITLPLSMIQNRLRETQIGQSNKPIKWRRQDEIGALIKEYNAMIAALEESAKKLALSERENAWREMAKQVAHEIKNPLTPLKLGIQLLERSWKSGDEKFPEKFERFSASFIEQIESLSRIATEFSDFAKMPQTQLNKVEIVSIISQVVAVYQNMDDVRISFNSEVNDWKLTGDKDQLLRGFNNLLKNAIEARRQSVMLQIRIELKVKNQHLQIEVHDNGTGIPMHIQPQIFTPNFTTKSSGTGLGLAFVRQAIENCGGTIYFQTYLNEGTTFFIEIPFPKTQLS